MNLDPIILNSFEIKKMLEAYEKFLLTENPNENITLNIMQTKRKGVVKSQFHSLQTKMK